MDETHLMTILVDDQKPVEIVAWMVPTLEDGNVVMVPEFYASGILNAWTELGAGRRDWRYLSIDDGDNAPCGILAFWIEGDISPALRSAEIAPLWDGSVERNGYPLNVLRDALGGTLKYGADIGESEDELWLGKEG